MVKDGIWYGFGLLLVAALLFFFTKVWFLTLPPLLLALFFLWFFRDPARTIPGAPGLIVSPADGVVTEAEWVETTLGSRLRVSIFLNVFDVHVNRSPVAGTISLVQYREGGFMNAMNPESGLTNEQTLIQVQGGRLRDCLQADRRPARPPHRLQRQARRPRRARPAHRPHQVRLPLRHPHPRRRRPQGQDWRPRQGRLLHHRHHAHGLSLLLLVVIS